MIITYSHQLYFLDSAPSSYEVVLGTADLTETRGAQIIRVQHLKRVILCEYSFIFT